MLHGASDRQHGGAAPRGGSSPLPLVPDLRVDDARTCEERYESLTSTTNRGFAGIGVTSRKCDGQ